MAEKELELTSSQKHTKITKSLLNNYGLKKRLVPTKKDTLPPKTCRRNLG